MNAQLSERHRKMLCEDSGISVEVIEARGYRTITDERELIPLGFSTVQRRTPGLLIPGCGTDGGNGFYTFRPDSARVRINKQKRNPDGSFKETVIKYEVPADSGVRLDCPPVCRKQLGDPTVPLWVTEGTKKADSLASRGLYAVALNGVWGFKGKNEFSGVTFLADWDHVALKGRDVRIVFDSDVMLKPEVRKALERLTAHLQRKGAHVSAVYLPGGRENKIGVDDFLRDHSVEELEALVDAPRPKPTPAPATLELLDAPPAEIRRPSALIDGRAYVATWLYVRVTKTESVDKDNNIVRHDPPLVMSERRMFIIRDDGAIFGEDAPHPITDLNINVSLPEIPPPEKLWSAAGVKAYRSGRRPDPADVFTRAVEVVDRFIDFNKSLADQRTMAEMFVCYVLSTWFLDAFKVIGFLWPNGEKGSGKTQLLGLLAELCYLGQVILSGGSFAALRDLADYGAMLCFDDAENLTDPKKTDPDKRTLLLAGNRRGNTVPLKEMAADKVWRTRYVNTFCPRAFSAIRLPDEVLASRTITVPLIRTPDRHRANAEPLEYSLWPHDRRALLDDLWALGLAHLAELPRFEAEVNQRARLVGRNLEPWRALLSVAAWLDTQGVEGIWARMEQLSVDYQRERRQFESHDPTVLIIRALCSLTGYRIGDVGDIGDIGDVDCEGGSWTIPTAKIAERAQWLIGKLELDFNAEKVDSRFVGRHMGRMRFKQPTGARRESRAWVVTTAELDVWVRSQGLVVDSAGPAETDVPNVPNVPNVPEVDFEETLI